MAFVNRRQVRPGGFKDWHSAVDRDCLGLGVLLLKNVRKAAFFNFQVVKLTAFLAGS